MSREEISEKMGIQPLKINANKVSPMSRNRYYWTNLPINSPLLSQETKLQKFLSQGREAPYDSTRCITTTNTNSSKSIKAFNKKLDEPEVLLTILNDEKSKVKMLREFMLVLEQGKGPSQLKCTELERIMGFPTNHTSGFKISETQRRKLLGNSFAVRVIEYLFSSLATPENLLSQSKEDIGILKYFIRVN